MGQLYTGSATDILHEVSILKPPSNYNLGNQQEFTVIPTNCPYRICKPYIYQVGFI